MGQIYEIKYKSDTLRNSVPASEIVGKKVIARNGKKIGNVEAIHIHPRRLTIEGIKVKKGIIGVENFIGKGYIQSLNHEGAMLKIVPLRELLGMSVYDASGKKIGEVKAVKRSRKTNTITSLAVKRGLLKKDKIIRGRNIREIEKNITLNVGVKDE